MDLSEGSNVAGKKFNRLYFKFLIFNFKEFKTLATESFIKASTDVGASHGDNIVINTGSKNSTTLLHQDSLSIRSNSFVIEGKEEKSKVSRLTKPSTQHQLVSQSSISHCKNSSQSMKLMKVDRSASSLTPSVASKILKDVRLPHALGTLPNYMKKNRVTVDRKLQSVQEKKTEKPNLLRSVTHSRLSTAPQPQQQFSNNLVALSENSQVEMLTKQLTCMTQKSNDAKQKLTDFAKKNEQLTKKLEETEKALMDNRKLLSEKSDRFKKIDELKVKYEKQQKKSSGDLDVSKEKIKALEDEVHQLQKSKENLLKQVEIKNSVNDKLKSEKQRLEKQVEKVSFTNVSINDDNMELKRTLEALRKCQDHNDCDEDDMTVQLREIELKLKNRDIQIDALTQKLDELVEENVSFCIDNFDNFLVNPFLKIRNR